MDNNSVKKHIEEVMKIRETQAYNLNNLLFQALVENNFHLLCEYLSSEIEFRGGIEWFSEKSEIKPNDLKKFFNSQEEPSMVLLSRILNCLGFKLKIVNK
ncbi:MAG: hypothetical protein K6E29_01260 [Cyanobacteria bacterium RUI128]|nr:hypothetical protein [Cyanobacteria bacterium RUI128]